ncbi:hypothetical protein ACWC4A_45745, partial [Streptomyces mirabilis]
LGVLSRLAPEPMKVVLNWGRRYSLWGQRLAHRPGGGGAGSLDLTQPPTPEHQRNVIADDRLTPHEVADRRGITADQ